MPCMPEAEHFFHLPMSLVDHGRMYVCMYGSKVLNHRRNSHYELDGLDGVTLHCPFWKMVSLLRNTR